MVFIRFYVIVVLSPRQKKSFFNIFEGAFVFYNSSILYHFKLNRVTPK